MQAPSRPPTSGASGCRVALYLLFWAVVLLAPGAFPLHAHPPDHPGILLLYYRQKDAPYAALIQSEIAKVLDTKFRSEYDLHVDTVQGWSATEPERDRALTSVLRQRYSASNIHVLIPIGNSAVDFVQAHGRELFPDASVVFVAEQFESTPNFPALSKNTGVILRFDAEPTLRLALQQNPGTRHVIVVAGSSDDEKIEIASVRNQFRRYEGAIDFQYATDMPFTELLARLSKLAPHTVVLGLTFHEDSTGEQFVGQRIGSTLSRAATAPTYVVFNTGVGAGAVGGQVHDLNALGKAVGELALKVLAGARASDIPVREGTFQRPMFDWRQMQRWGIKKSQLPAGSIIINREITLWERYKWWILGAIALVLLQAALIARLSLERFRKRKAESRLADRLQHEQLIAQLAASFIRLPAGLIGESIQRAFEHIAKLYDFNRIALFEFSEDLTTMKLQHLYRSMEASAIQEELDTDKIGWIAKSILARTPSYASRLADLPEEAAPTREYLQALGVRSYAVFPVQSESGIHGALSFAIVTHEIQWTADLLQELQIVADIFSNALERKRAEEKLRNSEELKTNIIDSLISHVAVIDGKGTIIAVNKKWKMFWIENGGPEQSSMGIGSNYLDICRQGALGGIPDSDRALQGILDVLHGNTDSFEMEYECSSPDEKRWFIMVVAPLLQRQGAVVRHRDNTFSKQAVNLLRESEERFRVVADSAPVMIWMSGIDELCTYFNKAWLEFAGRPMEKEVGNGWAERVHPDDLGRVLRVYTESFKARQPFQMQYRLRRGDDKYRWVLDYGVARQLSDGTFAGYIGGCTDVTDLKESDEARSWVSGLLINAQERERASIARELHDHINQRLALLAIEIHEFEHSVLGLPPNKVHDLEHLWELTNDISHDVQALSHQLHSSQLQHLGLVPAIRGLCQEFTKTCGVEAEFSCTGTPVKVEENASLALFRIAQEALRNAGKYSQAQNVKTELVWNSEEVYLAVTDDGVGFDPVAVSGCGLGLISMKERMRIIGGNLLVRSAPGTGSRIEARVPLVAADRIGVQPTVPVRTERRKRARA